LWPAPRHKHDAALGSPARAVAITVPDLVPAPDEEHPRRHAPTLSAFCKAGKPSRHEADEDAHLASGEDHDVAAPSLTLGRNDRYGPLAALHELELNDVRVRPCGRLGERRARSHEQHREARAYPCEETSPRRRASSWWLAAGRTYAAPALSASAREPDVAELTGARRELGWLGQPRGSAALLVPVCARAGGAASGRDITPTAMPPLAALPRTAALACRERRRALFHLRSASIFSTALPPRAASASYAARSRRPGRRWCPRRGR
jgi:hypothetical protein